MYVCHCKAITDRTIDAVIASGARTVPEVTERCRAGGGCGGCHSRLQALIDASVASAEPALATTAA
jgi:bacterioferritin-associated ferredoxin